MEMISGIDMSKMSEDSSANAEDRPESRSGPPEEEESQEYAPFGLAVASIAFGLILTSMGLLIYVLPFWGTVSMFAPCLFLPCLLNILGIVELRRNRLPRRGLMISTAVLVVPITFFIAPALLWHTYWEFLWVIAGVGFLLLPLGVVLNNILVWVRKNRTGRRAGAEIAGMTLALAGAVFLFIPYYDAGTVVLPSPPYDERPSEALSQCRNISTGLRLFRKDTGTWPIYISANRSREYRVDYLYGNMGEMPEFNEGEVRESWGTRSEDMYFILVTNGRDGPWYRYGRQYTDEESEAFRKAGKPVPPAGGWAGPYLPYVTDDPWGYAFLISVSGFDEGGTKPNNYVWCLSAGGNGIVETPAWANEARGDDVGICMTY